MKEFKEPLNLKYIGKCAPVKILDVYLLSSIYMFRSFCIFVEFSKLAH
jgi:hypothetical protein